MSILFTDTSTYIHHIPENTSGIYLTKGSHNKECFTCGEHITFQAIKDRTIKLNDCKYCPNQSIDSNNILESIFFTDASIYIQHIPEINYRKEILINKDYVGKIIFYYYMFH